MDPGRAALMSGIVIDASVALAWLLEEEDRPLDLGILEENNAIVPQIWQTETPNGLLMAERRGRMKYDEAYRRLESLLDLPISTDYDPDYRTAFALAQTHQLTMYDAMYLELALRDGASLATLDRALRRAATAEGVAVTP